MPLELTSQNTLPASSNVSMYRDGKRTCARCGVRFNNKGGRGSKNTCVDCRQVERDLALPPKVLAKRIKQRAYDKKSRERKRLAEVIAEAYPSRDEHRAQEAADRIWARGDEHRHNRESYARRTA